MITLQQNEIKTICDIIKSEEVIALPTDTVYGLACKYDAQRAINDIYSIKKRDFNKPLPVLVGTWEQAHMVGIISKELQTHINNAFAAGKVTFIVLKQPTLNTGYFANKTTIAIRISNSPFIKKVTAITGPLLATSCNLSNEQPITNCDAINFPTLKYKVTGKVSANNKPSVIFDSLNGKIIRN